MSKPNRLYIEVVRLQHQKLNTTIKLKERDDANANLTLAVLQNDMKRKIYILRQIDKNYIISHKSMVLI